MMNAAKFMPLYLMRYLVVFFLALIAHNIAFSAQKIVGPESTPIDLWHPIESGHWMVTETTFKAGSAAIQNEKKLSACPYPSLFILRSFSPIKIGKGGCQFQTYGVSERQFHIAGACMSLGGGTHVEMTTLTVHEDGRSFSSATTWAEATGFVTLRREGTWLSSCKIN
jgi:hypothetical protein